MQEPTTNDPIHLVKKEQFEVTIKQEFVEDAIKSEQFVKDECTSVFSECNYTTDDKNTIARCFESNCGSYTTAENFSLCSNMNETNPLKMDIDDELFGSTCEDQKLHERLFECYDCGYRTNSKNTLEQHVICNFGTHSKSHMQEHSGIHEMVEAFTYTTCKLSGLKSCTKRHDIKIFKCDECDYRTSLNGNLRRHMTLIHNREKLKYRCNMCDYAINNKSDLENHVRMHTGEKPFRCDKCKYRTHSKSCLAQHMRVHIRNRHYNCDQCNFKAYNKCFLVTHKIKHTGEKPFKCKLCTYCSYSKKNLKQHEKRHETKPIFECASCDFKTLSLSKSYQHSRVHEKVNVFSHLERQEDVNTFMCNKCNYSSSIKSSLTRHVIRVHNNKNMKYYEADKEFKCHKCEYSSSVKRNLSRHLIAKHGRENMKHKCGKCRFAADNQYALDVHARKHVGEKPFQCQLCSYNSYSLTNFKQHEKRHETKPIFFCGNCDFKTLSSTKSHQHSRLHEKTVEQQGNIKKFKCNDCDYSSSVRKNFVRHTIRVHSHKCDKCKFEANSKHQLDVHVRSHTGEKLFK